jgi:O-antigen ligase
VREWSDWKWLLRTFLLAGTAVIVTGMWQKFVDPEFLLNHSNNRVSGTLGNPIYYSVYGMFLAAIAYLLAVKESSWNLWRIYAVVASTLGVIGIFLGGTRGALLALLAGGGMLLISYTILLKEKPQLRKILAGVILAGVLILGVLFVFRKTAPVAGIPALGRLLNTDLSGGTANTRIMAWGIAVDAWQERPVFGWGPNNYFYAFNAYYRPEFLEHGYGETWFDNAHNIIMNTLAVQGTFGIIVYLGLFGAAIFMLWKKAGSGALDIHIVSLGTAFLTAHFIANIFVFENPTSYLYFMFFLAMINSLAMERKDTSVKREETKISLGLGIVVPLFVLLLIYATNIQPGRANSATLDAIRQIYGGGDAVSAHAIATRFPSPHIDNIHTDYARAATQVVSQLASTGRADAALEVFGLAMSGLEKNIAIHPEDIRVSIQMAQLLQLAAQIKEDPKYLVEAERILEEARTHSPKRQQLAYMLSAAKFQIGKGEEAVALLEETIADDPKIVEGWWRLAAVYEQLGLHEKAVEVIETAEDRGVAFSGEGKGIIDLIRGIEEASGTTL